MSAGLGKRAWTVGVWWALVCAAPQPARAEPGAAAGELNEPLAVSGDVERAARTAFEAGIEAAKAADFARARSLFVRSRELVPKPSTLINLAVVDLHLGLSDEAMTVLDELLRVAKGSEYERMRERAERLRVDAQALHDAQVGSALGPLDRVTAPVPAEPAPLPPVEPPPPRKVSEALPAEPLRAPPAEPRSPTGARVLIGSGVVLAAASVATGAGWWRNRNHALDRCSRDDGVVCAQRGEISAQRTGAMITTLGLDAVAVGLALGGGLWLARRSEARTLSLAPFGAGLAVNGAF
jgi:hypothetical protein